jgi:hypothetical protein
VAEDAEIFFEYANGCQPGTASLNSVGIGGSWRFSPLHQIDLTLGAGLNRASPDWFLLIGYSLRFDRLF